MNSHRKLLQAFRHPTTRLNAAERKLQQHNVVSLEKSSVIVVPKSHENLVPFTQGTTGQSFFTEATQGTGSKVVVPDRDLTHAVWAPEGAWDQKAPTARTGADLLIDTLRTNGIRKLAGNIGITEAGVSTRDELRKTGLVENVLMEQVASGMTQGGAYYQILNGGTDLPIAAFAHGTIGLGAMGDMLINLQQDRLPGLVLIGNAGVKESPMRQTQDPGSLEATIQTARGMGAKEVLTVTDATQIPTLLSQAKRAAMQSPPGWVGVIVPDDIMRNPLPATDIKMSKAGKTVAAHPDPEAVRDIATKLISANNPVLVVGNEVGMAGKEASDLVGEVATMLGLPVYGMMENFAGIDKAHPLYRGQAGAVHHDGWPTRIKDADQRIFLGTHNDMMAVYPDTQSPFKEGTESTLVTSDMKIVSLAYEGEHVVTSALPFLKALKQELQSQLLSDEERAAAGKGVAAPTNLPTNPRVAQLADRRANEEKAGKAAAEAARASSMKTAAQMNVHPLELAEALSAGLKGLDYKLFNEAIGSSGDVERAFAESHGSPKDSVSGRGGALGWGVPSAAGYSLSAKEEGAPANVLVFSGDGAASYVPQALSTLSQNKLPVVDIVLNNGEFRFLDVGIDGILKGEGLSAADYPHPQQHQLNPRHSFATEANAHGVRSMVLSHRDQIPAAVQFVRDSFAQGIPGVIEMMVPRPDRKQG